MKSGLTQAEVAVLMGFKHQSSYAKRELGIIPIGPDELAQIGRIFGYSSYELALFFDSNVPERERREMRLVEEKIS